MNRRGEVYAQGTRRPSSFEVVALGFDGTIRGEVARGLDRIEARKLADRLIARDDVASVSATKGVAA